VPTVRQAPPRAAWMSTTVRAPGGAPLTRPSSPPRVSRSVIRGMTRIVTVAERPR